MEKLIAACKRATDVDLVKQGLADRDQHSKGVNFLFADQHVEPFQIYDGRGAAAACSPLLATRCFASKNSSNGRAFQFTASPAKHCSRFRNTRPRSTVNNAPCP